MDNNMSIKQYFNFEHQGCLDIKKGSKKIYPRVLVISHNVFSTTYSMGKTLSGFFKDWNKKNIAQLYIHNEIPDSHICENYYCITDVEMLKVFKNKNRLGAIFKKKDIKEGIIDTRNDSGVIGDIYQFSRRRSPYIYIGRNLIWGLNRWKSKKLLEWLDKFEPDVIFFAGGDYSFIYKIALFISEYKNVPIISYICDDYYFSDMKSYSPLYHFVRNEYKRTFNNFMAKTENIIYICDLINERYSTYFNTKGITLMTSSTFKSQSNNKKIISALHISYIGNLA